MSEQPPDQFVADGQQRIRATDAYHQKMQETVPVCGSAIRTSLRTRRSGSDCTCGGRFGVRLAERVQTWPQMRRSICMSKLSRRASDTRSAPASLESHQPYMISIPDIRLIRLCD